MKIRLRFWSWLVLASMTVQIAGCGTLLYPERKGQKTGRIDPGVAILDAVGLFFFIIPGVVAFGVDFVTGAIYLPGGDGKNGDGRQEKTLVIQVDPTALRDEIYLHNLIRSVAPHISETDFRAIRYSSLPRGSNISDRIERLARNGFFSEAPPLP